MATRILLADPDMSTRGDLVAALRASSFDVSASHDVPSAVASLSDRSQDVLVADIALPGDAGSLVRMAAERFPETGVIVIGGDRDLDEFIELLRLGSVFDYFVRPVMPADLACSVLRWLETQRLRRDNRSLRQELGLGDGMQQLIGDSAVMREIRASLARVAPTDTTVLLTGSSGTGKEIAARAVHDHSLRSGGPFVVVHCGSLARGLLDSELFGHVRGSFTGAERARRGRFEEADGGTLFLDEVGTMGLDVQVRLLRALGSREISRVGEEKTRIIDARIVAATNVDLRDMVAAGTFREDLFYRLDVYPIHLPELKDRREDIPALASHVTDRYCDRIGRHRKIIEEGALEKLAAHEWPGNVRELDNAMQRAVVMAADAATIEAADILLTPIERRSRLIELTAAGINLSAVLSQLEGRILHAALERTNQNKQKAAELLQIQRTTFAQKLRRLEDRAGA